MQSDKAEIKTIGVFRMLTFGACILSNTESSETACHVCHAAESIWFCQCRAAFVLIEARSSVSPTRDLHIVNVVVSVLQNIQSGSAERLLSIEGRCILDNLSWARLELHIVWKPGCCTWEMLVVTRKISSLRWNQVITASMHLLTTTVTPEDQGYSRIFLYNFTARGLELQHDCQVSGFIYTYVICHLNLEWPRPQLRCNCLRLDCVIHILDQRAYVKLTFVDCERESPALP